MMIYDRVEPIQMEYHVMTESAEYRVMASRCKITQDDGLVIFLNEDSVQAMFRLDDVKALWRIS